MPSGKSPKTTSRRARPAKSPLGVEVIADTALRLLKEGGLDALSMRKVAAELDTGAASLYVYVKDLDELRVRMLDRALRHISPSTKGSWRERTITLLGSYYQVFDKYPGLAQIALQTVPTGRHYMNLIEQLLGLLHEGGMEDKAAGWTVDLLLLYTTAIAAENSLQDKAVTLGRMAEELAALRENQFPRLTAARQALLSGSGRERFDWCVETILNGALKS